MSYFDSLASWQSAGNAIQDHQQAIEQEGKDGIASNIQDKFKQADELMGHLSTATMSSGMAIHLSRKVYKKLKSKYGKKSDDSNTPDGSNDNEGDNLNDKTPDEHANKPNGQEDNESSDLNTDTYSAEDVENLPQGARADDAEFPTFEMAQDPVEINERSQAQDPEAQGGEDADVDMFGGNDDVLDTQTADQEEEGTSYGFDEPEVEPEAPSGSGDPVLDQMSQRTPYQTGAQDGGEQAPVPEPEAPSGSIDPVLEQMSQRTPYQTGAQNGGEQAPEEQRPPEPEGDVQGPLPKPAKDEDGNLISEEASTDNIDTTAQSLTKNISSNVEDGANTLVDAGTDFVKTAVSSTLDAGLETAGAVLDVLGPVGEVVGAGIALGSFFHDLFGHDDTKDKQKKVQDATSNISQSTGISTTSMNTANVKTNLVGTLV